MVNSECFKLVIIVCVVFELSQRAVAQRPPRPPIDKVTPVIPWDGEKLFGESDCLSWDIIGELQISGIAPEEKRKEFESKACKLSHGLECVNEADSTSGALKDTCVCLLSFGKKPVALQVEDRGMHCFIPAGQGFVSECFEQGTPPEDGFPSPYGDAKGSGPDPPFQVDEINTNNEDRKIQYLEWNTIRLPCVPHAVCREGPHYIGRRCQCDKNTFFNRQAGTCSSASRLQLSTIIRSFGTLKPNLSSLLILLIFTVNTPLQ